jgi:hypothetical protein
MNGGFNILTAVNKAHDFICTTRRGIFLIGAGVQRDISEVFQLLET